MITRLDTLFSLNFFKKKSCFDINPVCQPQKSLSYKNFLCLQVVSLIYMNLVDLTFLDLNLPVKCTKYDYCK